MSRRLCIIMVQNRWRRSISFLMSMCHPIHLCNTIILKAKQNTGWPSTDPAKMVAEEAAAAAATNSTSAVLLIIGTVTCTILLNFLFRRSGSFKRDAANHSFCDPISGSVSLLSNKDSVLSREGVKNSIDGYERLFTGARKKVGATTEVDSIKLRQQEYKSMVNSFYDLVTDFYEWGWGQSFHFAPRFAGETFDESIKRSEHFLALKAGLVGPNQKALDVGCGVGGPMRNIHQFTGADITGITINDYQVRVGNQYNAQKGIADKCRIVQGDFQDIPKKFQPETFDVAYAIEATCHSPDRVACYGGVAKSLKKGGLFVGYEWIVLPERGYDANNSEHVRVKEGIEVGNSLPTLATSADIVKALEESGFEVLDSFDANRNVHSELEVPWYDGLKGSYSFKGFRMTHLGRLCTHALVSTLEMLRIAPKGATQVSALLNATALDLVEGGEKELFTPSFFFLARKK